MDEQQAAQRNRRADRYKKESGVTPSSQLLERIGGEETPSPAPQRRNRTSIDEPMTALPVPKKKRPRRRSGKRLPRWAVVALSVLFSLSLVLFTADLLMQAYLRRQEEAAAQAHQRLLDNHPLMYRAWIEQYAAENNLQPAFVAAIILNESSYDRMAESSVGARGLMQLMEDTADWINTKLKVPGYSFSSMWDPETNIRFGCWYLGYLAKMFRGDPVAVTSAYHAGQGTVSGWLKDKSISPDGMTLQVELMPDGPTKVYAGRVTKAYAIYDDLYWQAFNRPADSADADAAAPDGG